MKKFFLSLFFSSCFFVFASDDFIVKKNDQTQINKMSCNALKEHIGSSAKKSLDNAIELGQQLGMLHVSFSLMSDDVQKREKDLSKKLEISSGLHRHAGQLQQHVAQVQKKLSSTLEKLIDDQKPFKKAEKNDLRSTYALLECVNKELVLYRDQVLQLHKQLGMHKRKNDFLLVAGKKISDDMFKIVQNCHALHGKLLNDTCLKNI